MNETEIFSKKDLAEIFGKTVRSVDKLVEDGIIHPGAGKPRKYNWKCIKEYISWLNERATGREKKKVDVDLATQKLEGDARIKQAKAEMAELELQELKGELHRACDVEAITTDHVLFLRSMLMAMPGKLAVDVAKMNTAAEAADRIKQEVYQILTRLSEYEYDPEEYKKRVRERQGWNDEREDEE